MGKFSRITVKLTESNKQIEKKMLEAIQESCNDIFSSALSKIGSNIANLAADFLGDCPEILELQSGGILRVDFGIEKGKNVVDPIIASIIKSIKVKLKPFKIYGNKNIRGGLYITIQPSTFSNLFKLGVAYSTTDLGAKIPWLKWLLTEGDAIIIAYWGIEYIPGAGRSGGGYMNKKYKPFKVNSTYSGTVDDNFITRAFDGKETEITNAIESAL